MALDDGRLGVENKFLENKSGRIFTFDKFTLENLANKSGCVQINLLYFFYIKTKPAMNNRRLLIAAVFHFVHPVKKDSY